VINEKVRNEMNLDVCEEKLISLELTIEVENLIDELIDQNRLVIYVDDRNDLLDDVLESIRVELRKKI
jgi:hypothetical protein